MKKVNVECKCCGGHTEVKRNGELHKEIMCYPCYKAVKL